MTVSVHGVRGGASSPQLNAGSATTPSGAHGAVSRGSGVAGPPSRSGSSHNASCQASGRPISVA